jgi:multidrug transporter EmrE-like cation transporter
MTDFIDKWIKTVNWKVGGFTFLPVFFGTLMALFDVVVFGVLKMIKNKTLPRTYGILFSVGTYALEPLIFLKALNYESMVVTNLVWDLTSDVLVTLQGVLIFKEKFSVIRWFGIVLSMISLAILSYADC